MIIVTKGILIYRVLTTTTVISPRMLALNDTINTLSRYSISITNTDKRHDKTYTLSSYGSAMLQPFVAGDDLIQTLASTNVSATYAAVTFGDMRQTTYKVTLKAGKTVSVNVKFQQPFTPNQSLCPIYSGYISVKDNDNKVNTVPYAGMIGDWGNVQVLMRKSPTYKAKFGVDSTNVFNSQTKKPITSGETLNATTGILVLYPLSTDTRYLEVDIISQSGFMTNERLILISEVLKDRNTDRSTYNTDPKTNVWKGYVQKARDNLALEPMFKVPAGSYIM